MLAVPFSRLFVVSSSLMGVLLAFKLYALVGFLGGAASGSDQTALVSAARADAGKVLASPNSTPDAPASVDPAAAHASGTLGGEAATASPMASASVSSPAAAGQQIAASDGHVAAASPCIGAVTCVGAHMDGAPEVDQRTQAAKNALLSALNSRSRDLDAKSRQLDQQQRVLDASQAALDVRLQALGSARSSMTEQAQQQLKASDQEVDRLVKIYENTPPRDASAIFDVLDMRVLVSVIGRMNPRKASAIMAGMSPERVNLTTQFLARMKDARVHTVVDTNG